MTHILDNAPANRDDPVLAVRKSAHADVWSVWAALEGFPTEEIFEASSEAEAANWINTGGRAWIDERRHKRNS